MNISFFFVLFAFFSSISALPVLKQQPGHAHCLDASCPPLSDGIVREFTVNADPTTPSFPHLSKRISADRKQRNDDRRLQDKFYGADRRETRLSRGVQGLITLFSNKKVQESIKSAFVNFGRSVKAKVDADTEWQRHRHVNWSKIH